MPDTDTNAPEGYVENPDFVPNPTDQFGSLDTSGTAGSAHSRIEEISAVFDVARAQDLQTAARALDPDDDGVHESLVVLPQGQIITPVDPAEAADRVKASAEAAKDEVVDLTPARMTPPKEEAAERGDEPTTEDSPDTTGGTGAPAGVDGGEPGHVEPGSAEARKGDNKPEARKAKGS